MADSLKAAVVHMAKRDLARARAKLPSTCQVVRTSEGLQIDICIESAVIRLSPARAKALAYTLLDAEMVIWMQGIRDDQIRAGWKEEADDEAE